MSVLLLPVVRCHFRDRTWRFPFTLNRCGKSKSWPCYATFHEKNPTTTTGPTKSPSQTAFPPHSGLSFQNCSEWCGMFESLGWARAKRLLQNVWEPGSGSEGQGHHMLSPLCKMGCVPRSCLSPRLALEFTSDCGFWLSFWTQRYFKNITSGFMRNKLNKTTVVINNASNDCMLSVSYVLSTGLSFSHRTEAAWG